MKPNKHKRRSIQCRAFGILFLGVLSILILGLGAVTFSKYTKNIRIDNVVVPRNFYFTSNYLKSESDNANYTVYGDTAEIILQNTDGKNVTTETIFYTFTHSGGSLISQPKDVTRNDVTGKNLDDDVHTYKLTAPVGTTVTVTAKAVYPYMDTLTASFTFVDRDEESYYEVIDEGYVVTLHIWTGKKPYDSVAVNYGSILEPDSGVGLTKDWKGKESGVVSLKPNAHYTLIFFDTDNMTKSYTQQKQSLPATIHIE